MTKPKTLEQLLSLIHIYLINPETSFCYNPFAYVRDDKDVLKLINNLIRNTRCV